MNINILLLIVLVLLCSYEINATSRSGVFVVTPAPQPIHIDEGRSAPFYYHNWMRRMDMPLNVTTTTTTTKPKVKTPDLIFAEFESDNGDSMRKSIRKLLEKERIETKTMTQPIYVPDQEINNINHEVSFESTTTKEDKNEESKLSASDMADYYSVYNNLYSEPADPVYLPPSTLSTTTMSTTSTTTTGPINLNSIWHIIDTEKHNEYTGNWEEVPVDNEEKQNKTDITIHKDEDNTYQHDTNDDDDKIDENFALPGFGTNSGNGGENESRAIRVEPNVRFPYINLKPFQMKNMKPLLSHSKKNSHNMYTNLDSFKEIKTPVRGEAQDLVPFSQPVDRYNPAQPYLPQQMYGSKSKQSSPTDAPVKTVANLVPPPLPPPPPAASDNFPPPRTYESFPPYVPSIPDSRPPQAPPARTPPVTAYQPPSSQLPDNDSPQLISYESFPPYPVTNPAASPESTAPDSMYPPPTDQLNSDPNGNNVNGATMDTGYHYKPPSSSQFLPTLPPLVKPFKGYSYDKPAAAPSPPVMNMGDEPAFHGYHYDKPKAAMPPEDHPPPSYGHHDHSYHQESDYPELIYSKPYGDNSDTKSEEDMKGNDMGMAPPPPPPPADMKPDIGDSEHGFHNDFPSDFKYHNDFDDHDYYHHHHYHPTTTTTTETPRVNRYSYYYLGKKLYYLPLYFSVYFIVYVGALIIKAVLRHKIVYPNSWRPNDMTASFFSKRSVDSWDLSNENLHEVTGKVTHALATAAEKYMNKNK